MHRKSAGDWGAVKWSARSKEQRKRIGMCSRLAEGHGDR